MKANKSTGPAVSDNNNSVPAVLPNPQAKLPTVNMAEVLYTQNETCVVYIEPEKKMKGSVYSIDRSGEKPQLYRTQTILQSVGFTDEGIKKILEQHTTTELKRRSERDTLKQNILEHNKRAEGAFQSLFEKKKEGMKEAWSCGRYLNELSAVTLHGEWDQYCRTNIPLSPQTINRYRNLAKKYPNQGDLDDVKTLTDAYKRAGMLGTGVSRKSKPVDPQEAERLQLYQTGKLSLQLEKNSGKLNKLVKLAQENNPGMPIEVANFTNDENNAIKYTIGQLANMLLFQLKQAEHFLKWDIALKALQPVIAWRETTLKERPQFTFNVNPAPDSVNESPADEAIAA